MTARTNDWPLYGVVIFGALFICVFAVALNALFYATRGPFYDSMGYLNHLAVIMNETRTSGFSVAFKNAFSNTTVALPWIQGILLAKFIEPSRQMAVWIQAPWLIIDALCAAFYFRSYVGYSRLLAGSLALLMISFPAIYFFNGGLSDLRVDLLQMLTFGSALAFYLAIRTRDTVWPWVLFGALLAVSCLARATTPVYIVLVFVPFFVADVIKRRSFFGAIKGYAIAASVVTLLAIWFFVKNFEFLRYYYLVWNTDAIARLPLRESYRHIIIVAWQHFGVALTLLMAASAVILIVYDVASRPALVRLRLNWRPLWGGVAPLLYLVSSGAGLNPFVSLVSIPGLLLFAFAPTGLGARLGAVGQWSMSSLSLIVALNAASNGVVSHTTGVSSWIPMKAGLLELSDIIRKDAGDKAQELRYQVMYVGSLASPALLNVLAYDNNYTFVNDACVTNGLTKFYSIPGNYSQPTEWVIIPGATDSEKIKVIAAQATAMADYIIFPEPDSVLVPHVPINPHAMEVRRAIMGPSLRMVGAPVRLSVNESVSVFRNEARTESPALCVR